MLSPVWNTLKLSKGISWDVYNEEASLFWGEEKSGGNVDGKDMWCGYYSSPSFSMLTQGFHEKSYICGVPPSVLLEIYLSPPTDLPWFSLKPS